MKIGLITCDNIPDLLETEKDIPEKLSLYNIDAIPVIWDDTNVNWKGFDSLIVRTPWDYFLKIDKFYKWLNNIESLNVPLYNNVSIIKWNLHKYYLRDLKEKGVNIIPTVFVDKDSEVNLSDLTREKGWKKIIIKPAISAAAFQTHLITEDKKSSGQKIINDLLSTGDVLVQEFLDTIQTEGEWSLLFFNGIYSHSIIKVPGTNDYRVQKIHGGKYKYTETDESIKKQAEDIIAVAGRELLYARVDGILKQGIFYLMELELIEPELFVEHSMQAKDNFIKAVVEKLNSSNNIT